MSMARPSPPPQLPADDIMSLRVTDARITSLLTGRHRRVKTWNRGIVESWRRVGSLADQGGLGISVNCWSNLVIGEEE